MDELHPSPPYLRERPNKPAIDYSAYPNSLKKLKTMAQYSPFFNRRNMAFFSIFSLAGGYFVLKSRTIATKNREKRQGDLAVEPARSGGGV
ncbi:hypothetical protein K402DRAFT_395094 [Aulographum hederae CBS 113979]|uniref:Uncharacterized protein n=1 Tax=Aulographum hederae CBS 113979 TaxID=1176131 RepID=A0A6G1GW94_9PEZI|nr:hypothetical protein K402DRAFT_395094 [Aulographum hederae CBS 113979]